MLISANDGILNLSLYNEVLLCKYIEFGATLMVRFVCFHVLS